MLEKQKQDTKQHAIDAWMESFLKLQFKQNVIVAGSLVDFDVKWVEGWSRKSTWRSTSAVGSQWHLDPRIFEASSNLNITSAQHHDFRNSFSIGH